MRNSVKADTQDSKLGSRMLCHFLEEGQVLWLPLSGEWEEVHEFEMSLEHVSGDVHKTDSRL